MCERARDEDERGQDREQRVEDVQGWWSGPRGKACGRRGGAERCAVGPGLFCFNGGGFLVTEGRGAGVGAASGCRSAR